MNSMMPNANIVERNKQLLDAFARQTGLLSGADLADFPRFITIETVAACNARCVFCPIEELARSTRVIKPDVWTKFVAQVAERRQSHPESPLDIHVYGTGEPLLDKKLESRIRQLRRAGVESVRFSTNASLMTPERSKSILDAGATEVDFSVDGVKAETHEKLRPGMVFPIIVENIKKFVEIRDRDKADCSISVRMVVTDENIDQYDEFIDFWSKVVSPRDRVYGKYVHNWGNRLDIDSKVNAELSELNKSACALPFGTMMLLSDGRAALCCVDYNAAVELGNLKEMSLQEIWRGAEAEKIRSIHLSKGRCGVNMCKDCTIWEPEAKSISALRSEKS